MASSKKTYTAEFFKKDKDQQNNPDHETFAAAVAGTSLEEDDISSDSSDENDRSSEDSEEDSFQNEDKLIAQLYRKVVDDIMSSNQIREDDVEKAIIKMKSEIFQGHRRGFRRFLGIDFRIKANSAAYLRRYAICHTGLVKKAMWKFFRAKKSDVASVAGCMLNPYSLNAVSLGGGPGNDFVGFCSALQESNAVVYNLDLKIVDSNLGWSALFSSIIRKATQTNAGSLSKFLKRVRVTTGFIHADLIAENAFDNDCLVSTLKEADFVLMVKLASFLAEKDAEQLLTNVVKIMENGSILVFIDLPYPSQLFKGMENLVQMYHTYLKYEIDFNPERYKCPSISSTQAEIGIFVKCPEETTEDSSSE